MIVVAVFVPDVRVFVALITPTLLFVGWFLNLFTLIFILTDQIAIEIKIKTEQMNFDVLYSGNFEL